MVWADRRLEGQAGNRRQPRAIKVHRIFEIVVLVVVDLQLRVESQQLVTDHRCGLPQLWGRRQWGEFPRLAVQCASGLSAKQWGRVDHNNSCGALPPRSQRLRDPNRPQSSRQTLASLSKPFGMMVEPKAFLHL